MDIDKEQLEFLMSRAVDGDLSPEETVRLDGYLAENAAARAEFERMKRLNDLLGAWGQRPIGVDDDRAADSTAARVRDEVEYTISNALDGDEGAVVHLRGYAQRDPNLGLLGNQYERLEMMIQAWGAVEPAVDYDRFQQRLSQAVRAEADRQVSGGGARIIRLFVPLAAAASLMIAAGVWWLGESAAPAPSGTTPQVQVALAGPPSPPAESKAVVEVSFGLTDDAPIQSVAQTSGGAGSGVVISIGGFGADEETERPTGRREMIF